jgi:hypothetical protein
MERVGFSIFWISVFMILNGRELIK